MHRVRIITLHEVGRPATALEKLLQFLVLDARQNGRVADFVAILVQDRQHGLIGRRAEKLVGLPCSGLWSGFRFAVADNAGDDQIGIVERRPEGTAERICQFSTFMN